MPPLSKYTGALFQKDRSAYAHHVLQNHKDLDWVKRLYDKDGGKIKVKGEKFPSTHLMSDNGQGYVFPRIQKINGKLVDLGDKAEDYARETGTGIQLPKAEGTWFARNGYKTAPDVLAESLSKEEKDQLLNQPIDVFKPITPEERDAWEKMQSYAHEQGFLGDAHDRRPGVELMKQFGLDPSRLSAYQQDFQNKKDTPFISAGPEGLSKVDDFYGPKTAQQRYVHFSTEHVDRHGNIIPADTHDFGTNQDAFTQNASERQQALDDEYSGMGDPTKNINYKPPEEEVVIPPRQPDPNFPTRDPITGVVTPALNKRVQKMPEVVEEEEDPEQTSRFRRLINGIFGNDHEGKPVVHVD